VTEITFTAAPEGWFPPGLPEAASMKGSRYLLALMLLSSSANMKPKAALEWFGNIYSRDSGNTYYATVEMQGPNSLRVEACALGRLFCSGNVWSRIGAKPEKWMTSRQTSPAPS
jgi:uncharacterized protein (DUF2147 family)